MSRRIFVIIIAAIILIIIAGAGYYFYSAKKKATTEGKPAPSLTDFFPFLGKGSTPAGTTPPTNATSTTEAPISQNPDTAIRPRLIQISTRAIAGATALIEARALPPASPLANENEATSTLPAVPTTENVPTVRYVERSTGHIYEAYLDTVIESRVSNTTIPRIEEAFFGDSGNTVLLRYLKDDNTTIETFAGTLSGAVSSADSAGVSTVKELNGSFLPENISDVVMAPDGKKIFYTLPTDSGVVGTMASVDGTAKQQIFLSPFSEWLVDWPKQTVLTATTKASGTIGGYIYSVDPVSGVFTKILGNIVGLTTKMSPDGNNLLYGVSKQNGNQLGLYDTKNRSSSTLGVNTLPEKCAWNSGGTVIYCGVPQNTPNGLYPDIWYQGLMSFTDSIWKIDPTTRASSVLINPLQALGSDIDVTNPFVDTSGRYLLFTNKKDSTLWSYDLGQ